MHISIPEHNSNIVCVATEPDTLTRVDMTAGRWKMECLVCSVSNVLVRALLFVQFTGGGAEDGVRGGGGGGGFVCVHEVSGCRISQLCFRHVHECIPLNGTCLFRLK